MDQYTHQKAAGLTQRIHLQIERHPYANTTNHNFANLLEEHAKELTQLAKDIREEKTTPPPPPPQNVIDKRWWDDPNGHH